jgi:hypothetical protein
MGIVIIENRNSLRRCRLSGNEGWIRIFENMALLHFQKKRYAEPAITTYRKKNITVMY